MIGTILFQRTRFARMCELQTKQTKGWPSAPLIAWGQLIEQWLIGETLLSDDLLYGGLHPVWRAERTNIRQGDFFIIFSKQVLGKCHIVLAIDGCQWHQPRALIKRTQRRDKHLLHHEPLWAGKDKPHIPAFLYMGAEDGLHVLLWIIDDGLKLIDGDKAWSCRLVRGRWRFHRGWSQASWCHQSRCAILGCRWCRTSYGHGVNSPCLGIVPKLFVLSTSTSPNTVFPNSNTNSWRFLVA